MSPGNGHGYLYVLDAIKGTILQKIDTGVGTSTAPSGLGKITPWIENLLSDNTTAYVYGGDLEGNIWKFDLSNSTGSVKSIGVALDSAGAPQPITTKPEVAMMTDTDRAVFVGTGRYLGVKDLTDPATQTPTGTWAWQQSVYAFKDLDISYGSLRDPSNKLVAQTITELSGGLERTVTRNAVNWTTDNGWYLDLNPAGKSPGERVSVDPQLVFGTLVVATNVPGGSACAIGGDSWIYQFDFETGSYVDGAPNNLVARKQTGALTVGVVVYQLERGSTVGQVQRSETSMVKENINIRGDVDGHRASWREITPEK